jgi:hypothetical protein
MIYDKQTNAKRCASKVERKQRLNEMSTKEEKQVGATDQTDQQIVAKKNNLFFVSWTVLNENV